MNTLKSYLESMFAKMPNTPEVRRAKDELWQMMEDKYNELLDEGKNENEAVGTVISEFGNLEELSKELGLEKEFSYQQESTKAEYADEPYFSTQETLSFEEVKQFVDAKIQHGFFVAIGVMFCIFSPVMPIISTSFHWPDAIGVTGMMILICVAVFLFVYSGIMMGKWDYIKNASWMIDYNTAQVLEGEKSRFRSTYAIRQTIGIILCVLCWIPSMIIDESPLGNVAEIENIGAVLLFVFVGIGVMMIVHNNMIMGAYDDLLKLNDKKYVSGNYVKNQKNERYINDTVATIMEVYWPTVTCVYLIWSFLSVDWHITWIIWPVAAIINAVIKTNLTIKE